MANQKTVFVVTRREFDGSGFKVLAVTEDESSASILATLIVSADAYGEIKVSETPWFPLLTATQHLRTNGMMSAEAT